MTDELDIRDERPSDVDDVDRVVVDAFEGRANEVALVRALRSAVEPAISRVAVADGAVVGHVMVSPLAVHGSDARVVGLAPLAVAPAWQGRGVGSRLVTDILAVAERAGAEMVVVLGDFAYYSRFGFELAQGHGVDPPPGVAAEALSVVCFGPIEARLGAARSCIPTSSGTPERCSSETGTCPPWRGLAPVEQHVVMILEHACLDVRPGESERFEEAFGRAQSIIAASPGFRSLRLERCLETRRAMSCWWSGTGWRTTSRGSGAHRRMSSGGSSCTTSTTRSRPSSITSRCSDADHVRARLHSSATGHVAQRAPTGDPVTTNLRVNC